MPISRHPKSFVQLLADRVKQQQQHAVVGEHVEVIPGAGGGSDVGGTPASHNSLVDVMANQHHAQSHVLATGTALGPDHTITGGVAGYVLRALGATTAKFMQLVHADLGTVTADQHHAQLHKTEHQTGGDKIATGTPDGTKFLRDDFAWITPASGSVPSGVIVMWAGLLVNIPAGWNLCDGTLGTPDLRSRMIRGNRAGVDPGGPFGSDTHSHSNHVVTQPSNHVFTQPSAHSNHVVTQPSAHTVTQPSAHSNHVVTQPNAHSNHVVTQPSNHTVTQPNNHVFTQPSNHSAHVVTQPADHAAHTVTQPNAHVVTQPNAHAVTQPSAHSDHTAHTDHDAHTTEAAVIIGAVNSFVNGPTTHTAHSAHSVHSAHTGTAVDAHAGTAVDAHSGTAVNAHSAHSGTAVDAHSAHAGGAVDNHSGTAVDAHAGTAVDAHSAHAGTAVDAHSAHAGTAVDAHAGTAVDAHSAHAGGAVDAHTGTAVDAHSSTSHLPVYYELAFIQKA